MIPPRRLLPALAAGLPLATGLSLLPLPVAAGIAGASVGLLAFMLLPAATALPIAFAVPFGDALRFPAGGLAAGGAEVMLGVAASAWWVRSCAERRFGVAPHPVWWALLALCAAVLASMTQAQSTELAFKELAKWLTVAVAAALGMSLSAQPKAAAAMVAAMLMAGTLEAGRGLAQAVSGAGPLGFLVGGGYLRAFGSFGQPNPFAAYLSTLIVLGVALLLARGWQRERLLTPVTALIGVAVVVLVLAVLASLSRGALLAMLAGVGLVVLAYRPRMVALAPLVLGGGALLWLLGVFGLLPEFLVTRVVGIFDSLRLLDPRDTPLTGANFAVVQRMAIWEAALGMWRDNPLLGVGAGNFDLAYPAYALPHWPQAPGHAHNYYLNLLAEMGIGGLLAYLLLLVTLLAGGWRAVQVTRVAAAADPAGWLQHGLALTCVGLAGLLTVHHLFDNLYVHSIGIQVGMLVGLALGAPRTGQAPPSQRPTPA